MTDAELLDLARRAAANSYSPSPRSPGGAALEGADGTVFTGCNIENAAFGPSVCAERTAIFKAVSEGRRDFAALAVAGGPAGSPVERECPPCGVCRQVLREFCADDFPVYMSGGNGTYRMLRLSRLLPASFRAEEQLL